METSAWFLHETHLGAGFAGFFLVLFGCLLLGALVHWELRRSRGPSYLPGVQCNRFIFSLMCFKYLWKHRNNRVLYGSYAAFGTGFLFQKEGLWRAWRGCRSLVAICNAELTEAFLHCSENNAKAQEYEFLKPWLKDGLLLSTGKKWKSRRRMLTPAFHFRILEQFMSTMNRNSKEFVDILEHESEKGWLNAHNIISRCTLEILCESIMGIKIGAMNDPNNSYLKSLPRLTESVFERFLNPLYWTDLLYRLSATGRSYHKDLRFVQAFHHKVIGNRKKEILTNPVLYEELKSSLKVDTMYKSKRLFLDTLLAQHIFLDALSLEDIEEEVSTFMFEGHDTTAAGLMCVFFLLATHPEVQKKVQEEVDEVFGPNKDRDLDSDDLKRLTYTDMVIKETLRLYPPVPLIGRVMKEQTKLNGYDIPGGASVGILIPVVHRDPRFYREPLKFNPEHFLPEDCARRHPFAYVPFSGGPRNCIGQRFAQMEERIVTATVMSKLNVCSKYGFHEIMMRPETTMKTEPAIELCFTPR